MASPERVVVAVLTLFCSFAALCNCRLLLTPYIEGGDIDEAQHQSRLDILGVESYSGYFTVDERYDSNMFFWFFPAKNKPEAPLLLWLNGGPGRTSVFGALLENGPLALNEQGQLEHRNVSWTESFSMLYIDNPVGTGYSYTNDDRGYSRTMDDIAKNLYNALVQFFKMFPQYIGNDFYIGGQSYAGKYIPPLACFIHDRNYENRSSAEVFINLKGMYLGGGYCDPIKMMPAHFDFLFNAGFLSDSQRRRLQEKATVFINRTLSGEIHPSNLLEYMLAVFRFDPTIDSFDNLLGSEATSTHLHGVLDDYLTRPATRQLLHANLGERGYDTLALTARNHLRQDFLNDTVPHHNFLIPRYKVLHYSGNLDIIVSVPMTEAFLLGLQWGQPQQPHTQQFQQFQAEQNEQIQTEEHQTEQLQQLQTEQNELNQTELSEQHQTLQSVSGDDESSPQDYRTASRKAWLLDGKLAGWYTTVGLFTRVVVRNAGHNTPYDQPERALDMMRRFVAGDFH